MKMRLNLQFAIFLSVCTISAATGFTSTRSEVGLVDQLADQVGDLNAVKGKSMDEKVSARFFKVLMAIWNLNKSKTGQESAVEVYSQLGKPLYEACQKIGKSKEKFRKKSKSLDKVCTYVPSGYKGDKTINDYISLSVNEDSSLMLKLANMFQVNDDLLDQMEYEQNRVEADVKKMFIEHFDQLPPDEALQEGVLTVAEICGSQGLARGGLVWMFEAGYPFSDEDVVKRLIIFEKTCKVLEDNILEYLEGGTFVLDSYDEPKRRNAQLDEQS